MNRITTNPDICHGKPCIRGLRYAVQSVLEWLAGGMTVAEILADYPDLESDDIFCDVPDCSWVAAAPIADLDGEHAKRNFVATRFAPS